MTAALLAGLLAVCALLAALWLRCRRQTQQLAKISAVLTDIEHGAVRHKLLTDPKAPAADICFQINRMMEHFNSQLAQITKQEQTYKQLLSSLSHDLRTPLASVLGYLEAVDENYIADEKKPAYIAIARQKAQHLKELVNTLFEWFKLDANETAFCFSRQDICECTREAVAAFLPAFEQAGICYEIKVPDGELIAVVDARAFGRIAENLLQNALVHSGASRIAVCLHETPDSFLLTVSDNGAGIAQKDLPFLFDRLFQCDPARTAQGSGLGLAITKALVTAHGGSISAVSEVGHGAAFTAELPKKPPHGENPA